MDEFINVNFKLSDRCEFGYLQKEDICIYIMVQDENEYKQNLKTLILELVANKFCNNPIYSQKTLFDIIVHIEKEIKNLKSKDESIKFLKFSTAIMLTNFSEYIIATIGNIRYTHKNSDTIKKVSKLENLAQQLLDEKKISNNELATNQYINYITNCIGGINDLEVAISNNSKLEVNDTIFIEGTNSWTNKNIDYVLLNVQKIKLKSNQKHKFFNKSFLTRLSIFLFSILFFIINSLRKNIIYNEIKKLQHSKKVYIKQLDVQNLSEIIKKENILYNEFTNKKFLLKSNNDIQKIQDAKNLNYQIELEIEKIKKIKESLIRANNYENNFNYADANKIYDNLLKNSQLKFFDINELNQKINKGYNRTKEYNSLISLEEQAEIFLKENQYKKALDCLTQIEKIYTKYDQKNKITNSFIEKTKYCNNKLIELENDSNSRQEKLDNLEKSNLKDALDEYDKLIINYDVLGDNITKERLMLKRNELEQLIEKEKNNAKEYTNIAKKYISKKKYKQALDYLIDSNKIYNKIRLEKEKNENNQLIRDIKQYLRDNIEYKNENEKNYDKNKIIESINLSIKEGDNSIKEKKWDKAIVEYNRAIEFSKKINLDTKQIESKLAYAIKSKNKKWFDIWK